MNLTVILFDSEEKNLICLGKSVHAAAECYINTYAGTDLAGVFIYAGEVLGAETKNYT